MRYGLWQCGSSGMRQRGIALILVLWVIALLTVIAGSFAYSTHTGVMQVNYLVSASKLRALADAGIHRALFEVADDGDNGERWKVNGKVNRFRLDGMDIAVTMRDESAKIDLNTASDVLLTGLLRSIGLGDDAVNQLLDAILDWRDADDLPRSQGAEREQYEALGLQYHPANRAFRNLEELRLVMGVTAQIYARLEPALTVLSGQTGINSTLAGRDVLLALPNVTPEQVDAYIEQRNEMLEQNLQPVPFPFATGLDSAALSNVYNMLSVASAPDGARFAREVVVRRTQERIEPYVFLRWREARLPSPDR